MAAVVCNDGVVGGVGFAARQRFAIRLFTGSDVDDAQSAVMSLCRVSSESSSNWQRDAFILLVGVALHLAYVDGVRASEEGLRHYLDRADWQRDPAGQLRLLAEVSHDRLACAGWVDAQSRQPTRTHPMVLSVTRLLLCKRPSDLAATVKVAQSLLNNRFFPAPLGAH